MYEWNGGSSSWVQNFSISDIDGEAANDYSGRSVKLISFNIVAIGAYGNDDNGIIIGHVRV